MSFRGIHQIISSKADTPRSKLFRKVLSSLDETISLTYHGNDQERVETHVIESAALILQLPQALSSGNIDAEFAQTVPANVAENAGVNEEDDDVVSQRIDSN
jgi:hypothetical protein